MGDDIWASLADQFADEAYASVKGLVPTGVQHRQLLEQPPPAPVLDAGGGAGHQSVPLAPAGYEVTLLDPSRSQPTRPYLIHQGLPGHDPRTAKGDRSFVSTKANDGPAGGAGRRQPLPHQPARCPSTPRE